MMDATSLGIFQDGCPENALQKTEFQAAFSRTSGSGIRSGFNATAPTGCQFLVCPDQLE